MSRSAHCRHARGWLAAALLGSTAVYAGNAVAQGCGFASSAQGHVLEFPPFDGLPGGSLTVATHLRLSGFCGPHVRVQVQSAGGSQPHMRSAARALLPYRVEAVELRSDAVSSFVRLLLRMQPQASASAPPGAYEHHLVLTLTP